MFLAVTTFNSVGLTQYGARMASSFNRHWPKEVGLRIYAEGWHDSGEAYGAKVCDLMTSSDWLAYFKERHKDRSTDNYRLDAVRFAHKIAAVIAADEQMGSRFLIWIDGDVFTHSPVPIEAVKSWAPEGRQWLSWLDRRNVYPECGFYIIDREHPRHREMMTRLREMYDGDKLFLEKEWHDSYILQRIVYAARIETKSLSGNMGRRTPHPFINGPLGQYMDHLKGKRKDKGRSLASDLVVKRGEQYWR